ncbi:tetratricopeptide repeat protein [Glaesserella sp.]|uniref:tetratricopeptide repeat protein n=1 Tax=Glaesserella sp. TaxID=2094731 RepID=UPI0035A0C6D5
MKAHYWMLCCGLLSCALGHAVQSNEQYHREFQWASKAECKTANAAFEPNIASPEYLALPVSKVKAVMGMPSGKKVRVEGDFVPQKEGRGELSDSSGQIGLKFRKEFGCNKNSVGAPNENKGKTEYFGTVRHERGRPSYIELDHIQYEYPFENFLNTSSLAVAQYENGYVSFDELRRLAEDGFEPAQTRLAMVYIIGRYESINKEVVSFDKPDLNKAVGLLQKAAVQHAPARKILAWAYDGGYGGLAKDRKKALELYHQDDDVDWSTFYNKEAQAKSLWFEKKDLKRALAMYLELNKQKVDAGLVEISEIYFQLKNYERAKFYLDRALSEGRESYVLGVMYLEGLGVRQDINRGLQLLNNNLSPPANLYLADIYSKGKWVNKDIQKAKSYYWEVIQQTERLADSYAEDKLWHEQAMERLKLLE